MSIIMRIPISLRPLVDGKREIDMEAATVKEAIGRLEASYDALKGRFCDDQGAVRRFINVYVNDQDIRSLHGVDTPVNQGDTVSIVPAIAGG